MGASNGLVDRNSKNRRFLEFRTIFETSTEALRCWKWPKIGWSYFCNSKNMRKCRGNIIFDSGQCLDIKFWNFVHHVMGGGGSVRKSNQPPIQKNTIFWMKKRSRAQQAPPPPSPHHVCRRSPPTRPPHSIAHHPLPMIAPPVALKF